MTLEWPRRIALPLTLRCPRQTDLGGESRSLDSKTELAPGPVVRSFAHAPPTATGRGAVFLPRIGGAATVASSESFYVGLQVASV